MSKKGSSTTSTTQQTHQQQYTDSSVNVGDGGIAAAAGSTVNIQSLDADVTKTALETTGDVSQLAIAGASAANKVIADTAQIAIAGQVEAGRTAGAVAVHALDTTAQTAGLAIAGNTAASKAASEAAAASSRATADVAGLSIAAQNQLANTSLQTNTALAGLTLETVKSFGEMNERSMSETNRTASLAVSSASGLTHKLAEVASGALERQQTPESQTNKAAIWAAAIVAAVLGLVFIFKGRKNA